MFKRGYYYLIAALTDYHLDGDNRAMTIDSIREEITSQISKGDKRLLRLTTAYYDTENIIMALDGRLNRFNTLGNYSPEEVAVIADSLRRAEPIDPEAHKITLFPFIQKTLAFLMDEEVNAEEKRDLAKLLLTSYYAEAEGSRNRFVRKWSETDRTIRNICAAVEARRNKTEVAEALIGKGSVAKALAKSSAPDFGLKGSVEYVDSVLNVMDMTNILKKERELDLLRWRLIEELTTFNYFDIDYVLGYYVRLCMISRWLVLDERTGREMFDRIVGELIPRERIKIESV